MARYEDGMIQHTTTPSECPIGALHEALVRDDETLRSVVPIMRQLVIGAKPAVFAEEIVARVRGSVLDIAQQLLHALAASSDRGRDDSGARALDRLFASLIEVPGFLLHFHVLALEWQLTDRLRTELPLDPALPPLLQALLASEDPATSALAMNIVAAQARFVQSQRRMQLALNELPADLLHAALVALRAVSVSEIEFRAAEGSIRAGYDESRTRLALIARAVTCLGSGAVAALSLSHAGVAVFATALSLATGTSRDIVLLSTGEDQSVRLALILRAARLEEEKINEQMLVLHPEATTPQSWNGIGPNVAEAIGGRRPRATGD